VVLIDLFVFKFCYVDKVSIFHHLQNVGILDESVYVLFCQKNRGRLL
jgi:hypothetical protein